MSSYLGHAAVLGGRRALVAGLSFSLVAVGMSGVAQADRPVTQGQSSSVALVAVQGTVLGSYTNGQSSITITKTVTGSGTNTIIGYVADITLGDATGLKAAFAKNTFGKNITEPASTTAKSNNAMLAINGDYYGFRDTGIIIRNGVAYRDKGKRQGLGIRRDGSFMLYDETKYTAAQLIAADVWQTLSFGPGLVLNGQIPSGIETYEIGDFGTVKPGGPGSIQGNQPRTGIGVVGQNHFVMIVVDGRGAGGSRGASMTEFAQMFVNAGATTAYNLDGGGSATMYFNGADVNHPSDGGERATSDILYVAK
jgi:exopolysaccharide biosynthesis protein